MGAMNICRRCVMDGSDPDLRLGEDGVCGYCLAYDRAQRSARALPEAELRALAANIRAQRGRGTYDCVVGVSGGADSSYALMKAVDLGLRPLALHLDNGWNTAAAVANIERLVWGLDVDLETVVLDWEEFSDLQRSFLLASLPDCEVPTDHAILAAIHACAARLGTPWIISGISSSTESHLPRAWSHGHSDWIYIRDVHRRHGSRPLAGFPHRSYWQIARDRLRHRVVNLLDLAGYRRCDAVAELSARLGWNDYGGKHHESLYTRFYQSWLLPVKFGYDKRRCHYSSLICAGEMARDEALDRLRQPACDPLVARLDRIFVAKKLGWSPEELERVVARPPAGREGYATMERSPLFAALRTAGRLRSWIRRPRP